MASFCNEILAATMDGSVAHPFADFAKGWETTSRAHSRTQLHENGDSLIAHPGNELPLRAAEPQQSVLLHGLQGAR